ncbi:MAG: hypothetical protein ACP5UA_03955 [Candidatus Hydrogenedens sp.]
MTCSHCKNFPLKIKQQEIQHGRCKETRCKESPGKESPGKEKVVNKSDV